ncbi:helix-turn-helix transcriptional regulator [Frankia sp. CNm7]|uniref:Helix-turn-helix transcriptional regulator n=1 Tax=Frankia nepalensis TaxID=1836974 RepID=A0A937R4T4_9ACTN|nr:helix-turn-helix transcriptional regulator [Frankia nepalensis]MBL7502452.1 helix-turn-helix transcriptional regulator [Frankia nepalensis]MBL7516332.1 helix-turn-helix transcriptional regulator [Frankia nepalensis]MBL7519673.1 helix-turn-helix transcriptional regulator [Frankia nepalensis]MBL7625773.1 helix-turn-helix transcriptional regulator [Frankia nepalensis]
MPTPQKRSALAARRKAMGYSQEDLAEAVGVDRSTVARWEQGKTEPYPENRSELARALNVDYEELDRLIQAEAAPTLRPVPHVSPVGKREAAFSAAGALWRDPEEAEELARRVAASDVGDSTLTSLESGFDDLACQYQFEPPSLLLLEINRVLDHVAGLMDSRKKLHEHRRLLLVGGWTSLLGATVLIDLERDRAASTYLSTALSLAEQAENPEIIAWCYETRAWQALTSSQFRIAVELSRAARSFAPRGSSIAIQAAAQEGRGWARLGSREETYRAIDRVQKMASSLNDPARPEHHYRYDPAKAVSYTATTLTWIRDLAAEDFAREVIRKIGAPMSLPPRWPRRAVMASIDLALTLTYAGKSDEALHAAMGAVESGKLVPSHFWRVAEVADAMRAEKFSGVKELNAAYEAMRHPRQT